MSAILLQTTGFDFFGPQHLSALIVLIVLSIWLPKYARDRLRPQNQVWIARGLAIIISLGILSAAIFRLLTNQFDWREDLPLDLCNLLALFLPVLFWKPHPRLVELLYFLILGGTGQGVITPNCPEGFPHILFLSYWIVHCGLVLHIIYVVVVWRIYPRFVVVLRSLVAMNMYAVVMFVLNYFMESNYFYVMAKPDTPSLLDFMGPWPWYILTAQPVALVIFFLLWLPFFRRSATPAAHLAGGTRPNINGDKAKV